MSDDLDTLLTRSWEIAGLDLDVRDGQLTMHPITDHNLEVAHQLMDRQAEVVAALSTCCGERWPNNIDKPVLLGCQLCPNSCTYWRDR